MNLWIRLKNSMRIESQFNIEKEKIMYIECQNCSHRQGNKCDMDGKYAEPNHIYAGDKHCQKGQQKQGEQRIVKMKRINIFRKIIDKFWEFKNQILYEIEWDYKKRMRGK